MEWRHILGVLCCLLPLSHGANILVIPIPLKSVFNLGVQAGNALREAGHSVWLMGPEEKEEALNKQGFHYLPYDTSALYEFEATLGEQMVEKAHKLWTGESHEDTTMMDGMPLWSVTNQHLCDKTLKNEVLINKIRQQHFDLAVMGTSLMVNCMYLIPYKFGIPHVTFSPFDEPWSAGITVMPSFHPFTLIKSPLTNRMTFTERVKNLLAYSMYGYGSAMIQGSGYQDYFIPELPYKSLAQLKMDSQMWFIIQDDTCLDYPHLTAPHYKVIGGLSIIPSKPLTGDLKAYADGATHGLILMTAGSTKAWGAIMQLIVPLLKEVAPKIKQRILLQYVWKEDPTDLPANVRYEHFLPQNDILGHKNTVAFLGHGGANGQYEAVFHGVPIICLGFMEEQRYNCKRVEAHHNGIWLPLTELNAENLHKALINIVSDVTYRQNMTRCSKIMRSMPHAKQTLTFWVNHLLEFGGSHLRPTSADMPFYRLFMLDVLAVVLLFVTFVVTVLCVLVKCLCRLGKSVMKSKTE